MNVETTASNYVQAKHSISHDFIAYHEVYFIFSVSRFFPLLRFINAVNSHLAAQKWMKKSSYGHCKWYYGFGAGNDENMERKNRWKSEGNLKVSSKTYWVYKNLVKKLPNSFTKM